MSLSVCGGGGGVRDNSPTQLSLRLSYQNASAFTAEHPRSLLQDDHVSGLGN